MTPCPPPEALMDLIDGPEHGAARSGDAPAADGAADLSAHVAACAACQAELAALRHSVRLLPAEALITPGPADLERMLRNVQAQISLAPAVPVRAPALAPPVPGRRLWLSALACALIPLAITAAAAGLTRPASVLHGLLLLLVPLTLLPALPLPRVGWLAAFLLPWVAASSLLGAAGVHDSPTLHPGCLPMTLGGALAAGILLRQTCVLPLALGNAGAGLAIGTVAGTCGLMVQVLLCHQAGIDHLAALHLAPLLLFALAGAALGRLASRQQPA